MQCVKPLVTYTCSNSSGTTCTKVAATLYIPSANTTCAAGEFSMLTQAEFTSIGTATANVTALQSSTSPVAADVATLKSQMALVSAGNSLIANSAPNPDVLKAEASLFGAVLVAAVLIYGAKRIYRLFNPNFETAGE